MIKALWTAASGMRAQQQNIDVIANNLANVNTTGFKKSRVDFQDLLYQTIRVPGSPVAQQTQIPTGLQVGYGVRTASTRKLFFQGNAIQTESDYDLMINGDGFFQVIAEDGVTTLYTRDGAFHPDGEGRLVTADGLPLKDNIVIPQNATKISVSTDGVVYAILEGEDQMQEIGRIQLAKFINPAGLENVGRNLFRKTPASGEPITGTPTSPGFGSIVKGFLEVSNVEVVEEMVKMITAQRAYEANSRAIITSDDMLAIANQLRR
jgi:flagellar basal-body rod protein FlgG